MAIDFGRMARNVATGYLGQKLANTAANDELKATIIQRAGINFYENILPEFQKTEKNRKETYGKVTARYGRDVAEYMDQEGFTNYNEIVEMLGANDNFNETKLKAYLESVNAGTYESRRKGRVSDIQDREKLVMGNFDKNQIGSMTAKLLLKDDAIATDAGEATTMKPDTATETITTPAVEGSQVGPQVTEATPEKTETREIPLPTYAEIFGDGTEKQETNFFALDLADREKLQGQSDQQYKTIFTNKLTGIVEHPKSYEEAYRDLPDNEKNAQTLSQYSYNRYFRERYLPESGFTYGAVSEQPKEDPNVTAARYTINILKANDPNDPSIDEIKADLKKRLGTNDLSSYGL